MTRLRPLPIGRQYVEPAWLPSLEAEAIQQFHGGGTDGLIAWLDREIESKRGTEPKPLPTTIPLFPSPASRREPPMPQKTRDRDQVSAETARRAAELNMPVSTFVRDNETGRRLFREYHKAPVAETATTDAPRATTDTPLDRKARQMSETEGISMRDAYTKIIRTAEGQRLYAEHRTMIRDGLKR